MKKIVYILFMLFPNLSHAQESDSVMIRKIFTEALLNGRGYNNLMALCKNIGGRLSGSPEAAKAVTWAEQTLKESGIEHVFLQELMVPHWVRGAKEQATIFPSRSRNLIPLTIAALGGSIGTGNNPLLAEVIEFTSMDEMEKASPEKIKGKIVFLNQKMDAAKINTFDAYGKAVGIRWAGAKRAAPLGAVAVIVRSVNPSLDDFPHTGVLGYVDSIPKIPACAVSTNDAEKLSQHLRSDAKLKVKLEMHCETLPDTVSHNVIGEIRGSAFPDQYIIVGGHLDSWDTGEGAHDDGAGVVQAMDVLLIFKALGIQPKHSIRAVLYMNEENGGRGGKKYAALAKEKNEKHIAAIESDAGGFSPRGFFMEGDSLKKEKIKSWKNLFEPYEVYNFNNDGGGADIGHLKNQGTFLMGLMPDTQRYFDVHHTPNDVFEHVNRRELQLGAATMAAMVYLIDTYGL